MSKRMKSNNNSKMEVDNNQSMTKEEVEMEELKKELKGVREELKQVRQLILKAIH